MGGRGIRLDILAKDNTGKHYDIKVQKQPKGAHVRRARFNSGIFKLHSEYQPTGDQPQAIEALV